MSSPGLLAHEQPNSQESQSRESPQSDIHTGGREVVRVNDQWRWPTDSGPSDLGPKGPYDFILTTDNRMFLFPKADKSTPNRSYANMRHEAAAQTYTPAIQSSVYGEAIQKSPSQEGKGTENDDDKSELGKILRLLRQIDQAKQEEAIERIVEGWTGIESYFPVATQARGPSKTKNFHKEYLRSILRTGRKPTHKLIAVDMFGNFDIDHDNPGPEVSPYGQWTNSGYLSGHNVDELAKKRDKERRRRENVLSVSVPEDPSAGTEARSRSSSVSDVSDVSLDDWSEFDDKKQCNEDCWLRRPESAGSRENNVASQFPIAIVTSSTQSIYGELEPGETRILHIAPGESTTPITCTLLPMAIPEIQQTPSTGTSFKQDIFSGPYEALSYTWGNPEKSYEIICNEKPLPVTTNLYFALCKLRLRDQPRHLWVDAVCINQENTAERNVQVRNMLAIYKGAAAVVVWLGDSSNDSTFAIEGMNFLDRSQARHDIMHQSHTEQCVEQLARLYEAQIHLLRRPWFRRCWIRQEIALAKKVVVHCGRDHTSWYAMKRAANRLRKLNKKLRIEGLKDLPEDNEGTKALKYLSRGWVLGQPVSVASGEIRSLWYYHAGDLLDLLMVGRYFEATDARDKVYSILGLARTPVAGATMILPAVVTDLATNGTKEEMVIDYAKSVSQVYQSVVKYLINRDRNLDILCIVDTHRNAKSHDLPSWVPDWRVPTSEIPMGATFDYFTKKFAAAGFTLAEVQDHDNEGRLVVFGYLIDTVSSLLPITTSVGDFLALKLSEDQKLPAERFHDSKHRNRLCKTDGGLMPLVPKGTLAGDYIFVLRGAKMLFVLHPRYTEDQGDGTEGEDGAEDKEEVEFEVVGPCLIRSLMYGSLIKKVEELGEDGVTLYRLVLV